MNLNSYTHKTRFTFGDIIYHKMTAERGMIIGIILRPNSEPKYCVIFGDSTSAEETSCIEFELSAEKVTKDCTP